MPRSLTIGWSSTDGMLNADGVIKLSMGKKKHAAYAGPLSETV